MSSALVQKLWNYCNILRDDGMGYGDYVEQLTYLIFLKMAEERAKKGEILGQAIPAKFSWSNLIANEGPVLLTQYSLLLESLGTKKGALGLIFGRAQNKFTDWTKLRRLLVDLIDRENWSAMSYDVKGDTYEGLLEKNAQDTKSGAGQYFTPRVLVRAIVSAMAPTPGITICDPACGTGGFLLASNEYMLSANKRLSTEKKNFLREKTFTGYELVHSTARLASMNMLLHGIGGETIPIVVGDALAGPAKEQYDMILTNPPFGKKGSTTIIGGDGRQIKEKEHIDRSDFWATTSNKQLNFVQHVYASLKKDGRAALVLPDNVLFEGGAGELIRRRLLEDCDVHTLLRLPAGLFYAQGVKANVLFFDKGDRARSRGDQKLWIYDLRTNKRFTLKNNPLNDEDLQEFLVCYNAENRAKRQPTWTESNLLGRWRAYNREDLINRDKANLDILWLKNSDPQIEFAHMSSSEILKSMHDDLETIMGDLRNLTDELSHVDD